MKKLITLAIPALLVIAVLMCFASDAKAQKSDIEKAFTSLGFKVTWKVTAAGADWELRKKHQDLVENARPAVKRSA